MKTRISKLLILLSLLMMLLLATASADEVAKATAKATTEATAAAAAPTVAEQLGSLQKMCAASEDVRSRRHAAKALYHRLGGYDRILELTREVVRLHKQNEAIKHMFAQVETEALAKHVADFMSAGTGGTAEYTGRDLPSSHAHLDLTDADFLSAGGDIIKAMQKLEYGQDEIDEVVCILVSLKDQVVFE
jgi:hemoglobin